MRFPIAARFLACSLLAAALPAAAQTKNQQFSDALVTQLMGIKSGQVVVINADSAQLPLAEDIAVSAEVIGAQPVISVFSGRLGRLYFARVPAQYDAVPSKAYQRLWTAADAIVTIDGAFDPTVTAGVPAARLAALSAAGAKQNDVIIKRSIPSVEIGNGLMPSRGTAAQWGVSLATLTALFTSGLNVDYDALHADTLSVAAAVQAGRKVHVTSPNGTNFRVTLAAHPTVLNDGIISAADRARGGVAVQKVLPAGDVYYLPVPGTANGTLVLGDTRVYGVPVTGLTVRVVDGKIVSMHAKSGMTEVQRLYAVGGPGRDRFAYIDFGANRAMHVSSTAQWGAGPSMVAGYVTVGLGNNSVVGGPDRSTFQLASNIPTPTVTTGSETLITAGTLAAR